MTLFVSETRPSGGALRLLVTGGGLSLFLIPNLFRYLSKYFTLFLHTPKPSKIILLASILLCANINYQHRLQKKLDVFDSNFEVRKWK